MILYGGSKALMAYPSLILLGAIMQSYHLTYDVYLCLGSSVLHLQMLGYFSSNVYYFSLMKSVTA
jgi:hypothetical protein